MRDTTLDHTDFAVRRAVYLSFARGGVPLASQIAAAAGLELADVFASYERLAAAHAIVLDPRSREVWMAMPFSAVPTGFRFESGGRAWYANCAWDAFGIAAALECSGTAVAACADCGTALRYRVERGDLRDRDGVVHFSVPAARWWDDIGYT